MKPHFRWMISLLLLAALAVIVTGVIMAEELLWGLGLALLLFLIILIPAITLRVKRLGRYDESKVLGSWAYSPEEAQQVAQNILAWQRKRNRWLVPFTAGCLAIIGGIFAAVLYEQFPEVPLWRWLLLLLPVGLPWLARGLYRWYLKRMILKVPCETQIGWNFLLWGNVRPVFNERETLKVMDADFHEENGRFYLSVLYRSTGRMRYGGKVEFRDRVPLLVPDGCEVKAQALVKLIRNGK